MVRIGMIAEATDVHTRSMPAELAKCAKFDAAVMSRCA